MFREADLCWIVYEVIRTPDGEVKEIIFREVSDYYLKIMGFSSDIIGRSMKEVIVNTDSHLIDACYKAAFCGQTSEGILRLPDREFFICYNVAPVKQEGYCFMVFWEVDHVRKERLQVLKSWNAAEKIIHCAKTLRSTPNLKQGMNQVVSSISQVIKADRIYIYLFNGKDGKILSEKNAPGVISAQFLFSGFTLQENSDWKQFLSSQPGALFIRDLNILSEVNDTGIDKLIAFGVHNTAQVPLHGNDGSLHGFLGIDNFDENVFLDIKMLLETVSYFVAAEIENAELLNQLEQMSHTDQLTKAKNRNALKEKMQELGEAHISAGVVFADINGLKQVNDHFGHEAGDNLIKNAVDLLRKVFPVAAIYRVGGDEFVVLEDHISQSRFLEQAERLRMLEHENGLVRMAIGHAWCEDSVQIEALIRQADKNMYTDKSNYYKEKKNE